MTRRDYFKTLQTYSVNLRGVAGHTHFSEMFASYLFWYQINLSRHVTGSQ